VRSVDAAMADLLERERGLLAGLPTDQQQELARLLSVLLAPFDATSRSRQPVEGE
jgi:hypothetical protein